MTLYIVALKDIQITLPVGIRDHEFENPQRLSIDIIMDRKIDDGHDFKTIDDCIDYSVVYAYIREKWTDKQHTYLLEHLASELLNLVMRDTTIETGTVTIHKPDIYDGLAHPSVTMTRSR